MIKHIKILLEAKNIRVLALLYSVIITIAFLSPSSNSLKIDFFIPIDKIIHFSIYFILSIIWFFYIYQSKGSKISMKVIIVVLLLFLVYGIIIEELQENFTSTRKADILDILANTFGSIIGIIVFLIVKNRIKT